MATKLGGLEQNWRRGHRPTGPGLKPPLREKGEERGGIGRDKERASMLVFV